jgi:membrane-associated phospholipid phosphatase
VGDDAGRGGPATIYGGALLGVASIGLASAFAFATAVSDELPLAWLPLHALAATVTCSRVHTRVHNSGDVLAGSLMGTGAAVAVRYAAKAISARRDQPGRRGAARFQITCNG